MKIPKRARARGKITPTPVKAAPARLVPTMNVAEALALIVQAGTAHMQANERGVLSGGDPEFLHQMRVALRRLRSVLSIYPETDTSSHLAAEMKWLAGRLGTARDWDVFLFETLPSVCRSVPEVSGRSEIRDQTRRLREAAWRKARDAVASNRYKALRSCLDKTKFRGVLSAVRDTDVERALQENVRRYAVAVLQRRYATVCKRGRSLHKQSSSEIHALRIAIKKLRYPLEFFYSLFDPPRTQALRTRLTALQDTLGLMNDGAVTRQLLRGHFRGRDPKFAWAIGVIAGWVEGRSYALRHEVDGAWKAFRGTEVFWK